MRGWWRNIQDFIGLEPGIISRSEILVSVGGAFSCIVLVSFTSYQLTSASAVTLIVPSMGSSALLLFALPHGRLSQPWPLVGGHLVAALIGVSFYQWLSDGYFAQALAVAAAIGVMLILRCLHPPAAATALISVIGGPAIYELGYGFVLAPVMLNCIIILMVAVAFNNLFSWRQYPVMRNHYQSQISKLEAQDLLVAHKYIDQAIKEMDLIVDLTREDLQRLVSLSLQYAEQGDMSREMIKLGHYYTNGKFGKQCEVRQIIDESADVDDNDQVRYRIVGATSAGQAASCSRGDFARWAAREIYVNQLSTAAQPDLGGSE